jgi:hypothetical protein
LTGFEPCQAQPDSHRWSSRLFTPSTADALNNLKARCSLAVLISFWGWLNTRIGLRIVAIPQRLPACQGICGRSNHHPDALQYLPDVGILYPL